MHLKPVTRLESDDEYLAIEASNVARMANLLAAGREAGNKAATARAFASLKAEAVCQDKECTARAQYVFNKHNGAPQALLEASKKAMAAKVFDHTQVKNSRGFDISTMMSAGSREGVRFTAEVCFTEATVPHVWRCHECNDRRTRRQGH